MKKAKTRFMFKAAAIETGQTLAFAAFLGTVLIGFYSATIAFISAAEAIGRRVGVQSAEHPGRPTWPTVPRTSSDSAAP